MITENKFFSLVRAQSSKILWALLIILGAGIWVVRNLPQQPSSASKKLEDHLQANHLFEGVLKGDLTAEALEKILSKYPELHAKYDGPLILSHLLHDQSKEGVILGHAALKRTRHLLPEAYQQFSNNSLLIAERKYEKALQEAEKLHALVKGQAGYEKLEAANLLRLVFLAKQLGKKELQTQSKRELLGSEQGKMLVDLYKAGNASLPQILD